MAELFNFVLYCLHMPIPLPSKCKYIVPVLQSFMYIYFFCSYYYYLYRMWWYVCIIYWTSWQWRLFRNFPDTKWWLLSCYWIFFQFPSSEEGAPWRCQESTFHSGRASRGPQIPSWPGESEGMSVSASNLWDVFCHSKCTLGRVMSDTSAECWMLPFSPLYLWEKHFSCNL